jgi:hypothetical protein
MLPSEHENFISFTYDGYMNEKLNQVVKLKNNEENEFDNKNLINSETKCFKSVMKLLNLKLESLERGNGFLSNIPNIKSFYKSILLFYYSTIHIKINKINENIEDGVNKISTTKNINTLNKEIYESNSNVSGSYIRNKIDFKINCYDKLTNTYNKVINSNQNLNYYYLNFKYYSSIFKSKIGDQLSNVYIENKSTSQIDGKDVINQIDVNNLINKYENLKKTDKDCKNIIEKINEDIKNIKSEINNVNSEKKSTVTESFKKQISNIKLKRKSTDKIENDYEMDVLGVFIKIESGMKSILNVEHDVVKSYNNNDISKENGICISYLKMNKWKELNIDIEMENNSSDSDNNIENEYDDQDNKIEMRTIINYKKKEETCEKLFNFEIEFIDNLWISNQKLLHICSDKNCTYNSYNYITHNNSCKLTGLSNNATYSSFTKLLTSLGNSGGSEGASGNLINKRGSGGNKQYPSRNKNSTVKNDGRKTQSSLTSIVSQVRKSKSGIKNERKSSNN